MNLLKILDGTPEPHIIDLYLDRVNESGDYHLATPMYDFQKELTDLIVSLHYSDILKYCETNDSSDLIIKSLEICINNCMLVSSHPYLLINHYMPKNLVLKGMSNKIAETSGKFSVLKDLINVIVRNRSVEPKEIGIVMNNNTKLFDLVEAVLVGCTKLGQLKRYVGNYVKKESSKVGKNNNNINSTSNNNTINTAVNNGSASNGYKMGGSGSTFHLIPHDGALTRDEARLSQLSFDALIVFDGYVDTKSVFFTKLRTQNRRGEACIIRLVPMKTIEHVQLYYKDKKDDKDYLYNLISAIVCLRDFIGNLPPDLVPIYNQNLNYLSETFFNKLFQANNKTITSYPEWPLPDLPKIHKFSSADVERSLLTEVHYHYTPYDSNNGGGDGNKDDLDKSSTNKRRKETYYELKRLQLDYVTNPLKNEINELIGIQSHAAIPPPKNNHLLTHTILFQLNTAYMELKLAREEEECYRQFNSDHVQTNRLGRRALELKRVLSKVLDELNHCESRITIFNKKIIKRTEENESTLGVIGEITNKLENFTEENEITNKKALTYISNQLKIWNLQQELSQSLDKINLKAEERKYMEKEIDNAKLAIEDSKLQIQKVEQDIKNTKTKYDNIEVEVEVEHKKFKKQKTDLMERLQEVKDSNQSLKNRLSYNVRFLRDTAHLKKRKGRGLTPGK
ncbi:histone deacetylase [Scheffersomyces spartinae]|uniref:Histone deacetylase n=1 Tax=Scheffersomyces spartinae TaxID=45513 RepID=A0A9P8AIK7_9ASCO|nr:histone deacetylase [Scheffersomyces spartinae]KAG7193784.1 histone deacetylase [Scheffersomyces spartinae]